MHFLAIILLCVVAAVVYGVIHDQITVRICIEYFTIGHPPVFDTEDPTLLGLGWGVIATWWVGVLMGVPLACAARLGSRPKRSAASLVRPLAALMIVSAVAAITAGLVGMSLARGGALSLAEPLASDVPADKHVGYLADLWAHNASYLSGFLGGGVVIFRVWLSRRSTGNGA